MIIKCENKRYNLHLYIVVLDEIVEEIVEEEGERKKKIVH